MNLLEAHNIVKTYANHRALDDVSIEVPTGSVYGLLGPNGAGKTTFIRIINHITAPDSGEVIFDGHRLMLSDVANIGYLPEERGLYKKMKVGEQAIFFARLKGLSRTDATTQLKAWFERLEISDWWNKKVEELSKGMAQKVQFIITVLHRPKLLIFDEPFSGFDPINANILKNEILKLRDEGATVIFSTHNMASVEALCDRITLINRSRNILSGELAHVRRDFGGDRLRLTFTGDSDALAESLRPIVDDITLNDNNETNQLIVSLKADSDRRRVIALSNELVDLRAVEPMLPSMDDIFIKAVKSTTPPTYQPTEN
jgi:ABC-2 type transport system ATP-binding protein